MNRPAQTVALVAHDARKAELAAWAARHAEVLSGLSICATGTTGKMLKERFPDWRIAPVLSGPLGGDLQIGAKIAAGEIDALVFYTDPLSPQPHDVDVKALIRVAVVHNIPLACNAASADLLIQSALFAR